MSSSHVLRVVIVANDCPSKTHIPIPFLWSLGTPMCIAGVSEAGLLASKAMSSN